MTLVDIAKRLERAAVDNSPSLLTGLAVVGTVATAYLTGKATIKAVQLIENEQRRMDKLETSHPMESLEMVKLVWTEYIPPVLACGFTIGCIIGAHTIGSRRAAAVAAAYSLSEKAYNEYRDKVVERMGDKKEQRVRDEIAQDQVDRNPVSTKEVIITGNGDVMCYESLTGRYFMSNVEAIRKAENTINKQVLDSDYASLSEFFDLIGLPATEISEEIGWNTERMLEVKFSTTMSEDGKPCISVSYAYGPIRNYFRVH